jgi:hypothetical protein
MRSVREYRSSIPYVVPLDLVAGPCSWIQSIVKISLTLFLAVQIQVHDTTKDPLDISNRKRVQHATVAQLPPP